MHLGAMWIWNMLEESWIKSSLLVDRTDSLHMSLMKRIRPCICRACKQVTGVVYYLAGSDFPTKRASPALLQIKAKWRGQGHLVLLEGLGSYKQTAFLPRINLWTWGFFLIYLFIYLVWDFSFLHFHTTAVSVHRWPSSASILIYMDNKHTEAEPREAGCTGAVQASRL